MSSSSYMGNLSESFVHSNTAQCDTSQYYFLSIVLETLDWKELYGNDKDTTFIMDKLYNE